MNWFVKFGITEEEVQRNLARLPADIAEVNAGRKATCNVCYANVPSADGYLLIDDSTVEIDNEVTNCFKATGTCQKCGHQEKVNFLGDWSWK